MNSLALTVLSAIVLLGAALLWTTVANRRRQGVQQRLKAVVSTTARSEDEPVASLSLRRRISQAGSGAWHELPRVLRARLEAELAVAGNRIGSPHLIAAACLGGGAVFALAFYVLGLSLVLVLLLAGAAAPVAATGLLRLAQARYSASFVDVFPDALDLVCRAIRAGLPVNDAMAVAAREDADPVGSELRQAMSEMQIGVEPQEALQRVADRIRVPDFRFYVVALALQRKTGGSLAETLTNLSTVIRARKMLRLKAQALSSEAKASAAVLAMLPFGVGGLMYLFNRDLMSILFTDPRGRFMLGVAFSTLVAGILMMRSIINRTLR